MEVEKERSGDGFVITCGGTVALAVLCLLLWRSEEASSNILR